MKTNIEIKSGLNLSYPTFKGMSLDEKKAFIKSKVKEKIIDSIIENIDEMIDFSASDDEYIVGKVFVNSTNDNNQEDNKAILADYIPEIECLLNIISVMQKESAPTLLTDEISVSAQNIINKILK